MNVNADILIFHFSQGNDPFSLRVGVVLQTRQCCDHPIPTADPGLVGTNQECHQTHTARFRLLSLCCLQTWRPRRFENKKEKNVREWQLHSIWICVSRTLKIFNSGLWSHKSWACPKTSCVPLSGNNSGILSLGILTTRLRKRGITWHPEIRWSYGAKSRFLSLAFSNKMTGFTRSSFRIASHFLASAKYGTKKTTPSQLIPHNEPEHLIVILQLGTLPPGKTEKVCKKIGTHQVQSTKEFFKWLKNRQIYSNIQICCLPVSFSCLFQAFFSSSLCPCSTLAFLLRSPSANSRSCILALL